MGKGGLWGRRWVFMGENAAAGVVNPRPFNSSPTAPAPHASVTPNFTADSPCGVKLSKFSLCSPEVSFLWEICTKSAQLCSNWIHTTHNTLFLSQLERDGLQGTSPEVVFLGTSLVSESSRLRCDHSDDAKQPCQFQRWLDQWQGQ